MSTLPYVISAELDLPNPALDAVVERTAVEGFREKIDTALRKLNKDTTWVDSTKLATGMDNAIAQTSLPIVSLDDRYVSRRSEAVSGYLGVSRGVDLELQDVGYLPRVGYRALEEQLAGLDLAGEVVIVDDVLFSGDMMLWLADELDQRNITLSAVICGIAIGEGAQKLQVQGIDVVPVVSFNEVEDELCERDLAMVPGSGRRVDDGASGLNALYFDRESGKPAEWASLPADIKLQDEFAFKALLSSVALLKDGATFEQLGRFRSWPTAGQAKPAIQQKADKLVDGLLTDIVEEGRRGYA